MCQPKPGPRCSTDMYKSTQTKHRALEDSQKNLKMAEGILRDLQRDEPNEERRIAQVKEKVDYYHNEIQARENEYREEVYSYYATPSGMTQLISESVRKADEVCYKISGAFDDSNEWQQKQIKLPGNYMENIINQNAETHRAWQQETLKALESKTVREKRDLVESELQKHTEQRKAINDAYLAHQKNESQLLQIPAHADTPETVAALKEEYKSMRAYEVKNLYNEMQIKDLQSLSY